MKKIIKAATYGDDFDVFMEQLDMQGYHHDYVLKYDGDGSHFFFEPFGEMKKFLPKIEVVSNEEDGSIYFTPSLIMPSKIDGDDVQFADSFEYYMNLYQEAGKLCTQIFKSVYTPGMYSDE